MNNRSSIRSRITIALCALALSSLFARAETVVLSGDQGDYTFQSGKTYYLTNHVHIVGTATIEAGTVIKCNSNGQLTVDGLDCQTVSTNPAIFTVRDDDRFGDTLPDSTGAPSGYYGWNDMLQINCGGDVSLHDVQFYYYWDAVGFVNQTGDDYITFSVWNVRIENCGWGIDCWNAQSSGENILNATNLTMIDCSGGILGHYNIAGNIVDSTFVDVGGLVSDDDGYFFNPLHFSWCTFTDVALNAWEVDVSGDHNGFADCSNFSNYDYNHCEDNWYVATNYFGDSWYWLTNSAIQFSVATPDYYVQQFVPVQVDLLAGTVFYQSVVVKTNGARGDFSTDLGDPAPDFSDAVWTDYSSSNVLADLGGLTNGIFEVWIGLRGARDYPPVWQKVDVQVDTRAPVITITNPTATTLGIPLIQVKGEANENLSQLTYSISNALHIVTNQAGAVLHRFFDTNRWDFTTNYFECHNVYLAPGHNLVAVRAVDLAGNVTVTNLSLTLDYSIRTNPPVTRLVYPRNGMQVVGTNLTACGFVDDPTATVAAQWTGAGTPRTFTGVVEGSGRFWIDNVPVAAGTNHLALTITDAAGNVLVTNVAFMRSTMTLTVDQPSDLELVQPLINVHGTVSDPAATVMVNGVTGVNDGGSWNAENVPNASGGVSIFKVTSYSSAVPSASGSTVDPTDNPDSSSSTNAEVTFEKPVAELLCIADDMSGDFYEHSLYTNTGYIYDGKRFQHFNQYWNYGGGGRGFETNYDYLIERSFDQDWTSQTNDWIFGPAYGWITWTNKLYPYGGNIEIAPNDLGLHQLVGMEHCDVWNCSPPTDSPGAGYLYSYTRHYRRTAQTHMRLFVGGRDIGPYIIWLNGWAHDIANIELRNFPVGGEWHTTYTPIWIQPSMPYGMIVIGGVGPLDPEGRVRLTAWPGEEVDVTPAVAGHVFYTFQVGLGSVDPMPD